MKRYRNSKGQFAPRPNRDWSADTFRHWINLPGRHVIRGPVSPFEEDRETAQVDGGIARVCGHDLTGKIAKSLSALILGLFLASCVTHPVSGVVCTDSDTLQVRHYGFPVARYDCVTSRYGFGGRPGSKRTPRGTFQVTDCHPKHRFGPSLRLGGMSEDGYRQDHRGILIHQTRNSGTNGCIGLDPLYMQAVYNSLPVGSTIHIQ